MNSQTFTLESPEQPLIICDVDEVVVHFLQPLRKFLNSCGFRLESNNFSLNDNIFSVDTNKLAGSNKVQQLLLQFYDIAAENLPIVENAKESLHVLSKLTNIVFLSNIPEQFKIQRQRNLESHGLLFPLLINHGPKGPFAATLAAQTSSKIFFIDDNPLNLRSVRENITDVHLIQFIADEVFFNLSPQIKCVKLKSRNWNQIEQYIEGVLNSSPN